MNDNDEPNQDIHYAQDELEVENLSDAASAHPTQPINDPYQQPDDDLETESNLGHQFQDEHKATTSGPTEFSWNASEFIHHQKKTSWYLIFGLIVIALIIITILTHQWFSAALFVVMASALVVYANKEPRLLRYHLNESGITIEQKLYKYSQFRSFAIFNDVAWHSIDLDPLQRFQPRLTVMFDSNDLPHIESILSSHLPRIDREPDLVERATRFLKF